jgi:hypothetical protein
MVGAQIPMLASQHEAGQEGHGIQLVLWHAARGKAREGLHHPSLMRRDVPSHPPTPPSVAAPGFTRPPTRRIIQSRGMGSLWGCTTAGGVS